MTTIGDLADLLEMALTHTSNPALRRIKDRATIIDIAREYLPRTVWMDEPHRRAELDVTLEVLTQGEERDGTRPLDLTDPGTAHALLVALTLAMGRDPGEGGLGVSWYRTRSGAWRLDPGSDLGDAPDEVPAPMVVTETHPVRALEQAVAYVLRGGAIVAPTGGDR